MPKVTQLVSPWERPRGQRAEAHTGVWGEIHGEAPGTVVLPKSFMGHFLLHNALVFRWENTMWKCCHWPQLKLQKEMTVPSPVWLSPQDPLILEWGLAVGSPGPGSNPALASPPVW